MSEILAAFPAADAAGLVKVGRKTVYRTPEGDMNRCTSILEALPKPFLVPWAAGLERAVVLEAAADVFIDPEFKGDGPAAFIEEVERRMGPARAHQKTLEEAADIGSKIHNEIQRRTRLMLDLPAAPAETLPDAATLAVMAWEDWFKSSGLRPFRSEQVVWDSATKVAGTIDLLAFNRDGRLGIVDYKSSKGIYDSHHVQVAKYVQMASNFAPIEWADIVRLPKRYDDPFLTTPGSAFEVKPLGTLYDRKLTVTELLRVFEAARTIYELTMQKVS